MVAIKNARNAVMKLLQKEVKEQTPIKQKMGEDEKKDYERRLKKISERVYAGSYMNAFEKLQDVIRALEDYSGNIKNEYGLSEQDKKLLQSVYDYAEYSDRYVQNPFNYVFLLVAITLSTLNDPSFSSQPINLDEVYRFRSSIERNPLFIQLYSEADQLPYLAIPMKVEESNKTGVFSRFWQGGKKRATKKRSTKKRLTKKRLTKKRSTKSRK